MPSHVEEHQKEPLDIEWLELVLMARHIGLSIEEVRAFLSQKQSSELNVSGQPQTGFDYVSVSV